MSLSVIALSCGLHEIGGSGEVRIDGNIWGGIADVEQDGADALLSVCYMTAVDYKKGYDWRADPAEGDVKCSIVVYADGVPVMKVPVGAEYETSGDPDMHRIIDGHLYTDYSTDAETIIKRDGKTLFGYDGRESLRGMEVVDDDVYTLGQNRDGDGFSFRKNGECIISRNTGYVAGGLQQCSDTLCFSFCEQIVTADGLVERYYSVIGGKVSQIAVRTDISSVWDVVIHKGRVIYLASLVGVLQPVVIDGDKMFSLQTSVSPNSRMLSCRLFMAGDRIGAEGIYMISNGVKLNALWLDGKEMKIFPLGRSVAALGASEDGDVFCAVNPAGKTLPGIIYNGGEAVDMPSGYAVMGERCISKVNGILHVALSSSGSGYPVIWKESSVDTLKINGYISSISGD